MTHLGQRLVVYARNEHRDGHGSTLRLHLARPALQQRRPISARDGIHLVKEEKHGRLGRILLQRVDAIAVVRGVLGRVVRGDINNVDQHAEMLEELRALGGRYES
jgi:hypothetical protein